MAWFSDATNRIRSAAGTSARSATAATASGIAISASGSNATGWNRVTTICGRISRRSTTVSTGGSTIKAIERVRDAGHQIVGVVAILDRLAGGGESIQAAIGDAPYVALTTIDDVYPERPDR